MTRFTPSLRPFLLIVGLFLLGCQAAAPHEEEEAHEAPVHAEAARKVVLGEWTDLLGTTVPLPNHSAHVSAAVEGHVVSVLGDGKGAMVVEGQQVEAGQVIVRLDDSVLRANRDKLQASLDDLEEQRKQAGYALDLARIDVNRLKELQKSGSAGGPLPLVSRVELEKAEVMQRDAESKQRGVAARLIAARADLNAVEKQMAFYTLRVPIAGRLSTVQAVPGQTLTPGTVVADVVDLGQIDVLCYAPPDAATRLALSQPAKLLLAEPGSTENAQPLQGQVVFVGVQAQAETGNVSVKVRFPNPDLRLRAHAIVRVVILTKPEKERLTIPESALMEDLDVPTVVAVQDVKTEHEGHEEKRVGKARKLRVVLGVRDRERRLVEVLALEDPETKQKVDPKGMLFVTAGGGGLENDDEVKLEEEDPEEGK